MPYLLIRCLPSIFAILLTSIGEVSLVCVVLSGPELVSVACLSCFVECCRCRQPPAARVDCICQLPLPSRPIVENHWRQPIAVSVLVLGVCELTLAEIRRLQSQASCVVLSWYPSRAFRASLSVVDVANHCRPRRLHLSTRRLPAYTPIGQSWTINIGGNQSLSALAVP